LEKAEVYLPRSNLQQYYKISFYTKPSNIRIFIVPNEMVAGDSLVLHDLTFVVIYRQSHTSKPRKLADLIPAPLTR
jgi:hypothetical protein